MASPDGTIHKRTYAINDPFQLPTSASMRNGVQLNALMIVASLSDSHCSLRQRVKGGSRAKRARYLYNSMQGLY